VRSNDIHKCYIELRRAKEFLPTSVSGWIEDMAGPICLIQPLSTVRRDRARASDEQLDKSERRTLAMRYSSAKITSYSR